MDVESLPAARVEAEPTRMQEMAQRAQELVAEAERVRVAEGLPPAGEVIDVNESAAGAMPKAATESAGPLQTGEAGSPPSAAGDATRPADPLEVEARSVLAKLPDGEITVGREADGTPIRKKASELLDEAKAATRQAEADASLFRVAAACMLGVG